MYIYVQYNAHSFLDQGPHILAVCVLIVYLHPHHCSSSSCKAHLPHGCFRYIHTTNCILQSLRVLGRIVHCGLFSSAYISMYILSSSPLSPASCGQDGAGEDCGAEAGQGRLLWLLSLQGGTCRDAGQHRRVRGEGWRQPR